MRAVRTRFAPSPTGSLHVGNARIAVLNWAIARHHDGAFILRIEDTDVQRNVAGAEAELMADLRWLGLDWDEGPSPDDGEDRGDHGPYRQRDRLRLYNAARDALLTSGAAYRCFCSPEELEENRNRALAGGRPPHYPGACRGLDRDESAERAADGTPHVIRLATPESGDVVVEDEVRGRVVFDASDLGDFVLVRTDGLPTYNFAVVVDDAEMAITHVIRGAGHLSNTPHQVLLYDAMGLEPPVFAHAPTVLGPDRKKLSKRTGARPLRALREEGVHPDAIVNYLSLLGWSSPSGEEVLPPARIAEEVTLERVNAADVVFDPTKLHWLSARHIERMSTEGLIAAVRPYVRDSPTAPLLEGDFATALEAVRSHLGAFSEVTRHLPPFLGLLDDEGRARRDRLASDPAAVAVLRAARSHLDAMDAWQAPAIQAALKAAGKEVGAKGRGLFMPIRVALTGEEHGPPLPVVAQVQGRERVLGMLGEAAAE